MLISCPLLFVFFSIAFCSCPARECHGAFKCEGHFIDSFEIDHLEDCLKACSDVSECMWFTLEKTHNHCILYEDCEETNSCETCASGERDCSVGYHGEVGWLKCNWLNFLGSSFSRANRRSYHSRTRTREGAKADERCCSEKSHENDGKNEAHDGKNEAHENAHKKSYN